jgi:hypothetical protein
VPSGGGRPAPLHRETHLSGARLPPGMTGSVSPKQRWRQVGHINAVGYIMLAGLAVLFLPLLPFIALLYLFDRLQASPEEPA